MNIDFKILETYVIANTGLHVAPHLELHRRPFPTRLFASLNDIRTNPKKGKAFEIPSQYLTKNTPAPIKQSPIIDIYPPSATASPIFFQAIFVKTKAQSSSRPKTAA